LIAEAQTVRAGDALRESRSLNRPQVYAGTGLAYNNGFPLSIEGSAPSIFQVGVSQSILSKKNKNLIREAEEAGEASRFKRKSVENELAAQTALAYFRLHQARKLINLTSRRLETVREQLEAKESLLQSGKIRPVDFASVKSVESFVRQQLLVAEEQANIAETELINYTGLPSTVSIQTSEPVIKKAALEFDADLLYRRAIENSPEIQQAEADIRAKEYHLEAEKGERYPVMKLIGEYALFSRANNYEDYYNRFERNNYQLGLSIQVPIFDGFRSSARIAQSRQEAAEAQYRLQQAKSNLELAVQRGLSNLRIANGALEYAQNEIEVARENIRVDEALLQSGRISREKFQETRAQLLQKQYEQADAEKALFQSKLELLNIIGDVSSAFE